MQRLALVLKILAPVFFVVGALHLALGLGAEALLGANVPELARIEPSLSSQNRFYGVAFTLYGAVLWLAARNLRTYSPFFKAAMWVFFTAGLARLVAWVQHGAPAPLVVALLVSELVAPLALLAWFRKVQHEA